MNPLVQGVREKQLPKHLISLYGEDWAAWRGVAVRGAGFPAAMALRLSSPELAALGDQLLEIERHCESAQRRALSAILSALDEIKPVGDRARRKTFLKALTSLKKGKIPKCSEILAGVPELAAFAEARQRAAAAQTEFHQAYDTALTRQRERIHESACNRRFQEAVLWQNPNAYHTAVRKVAAVPPGARPRDSQRRQHEEAVASYLQRYSVKNDTIGFFGPVGWASFAEDAKPLELRPGPQLVADRQVYLESWCVHELARAMMNTNGVRSGLRPQRLPFVRVVGNTLHLPLAQPQSLRPAEAELLRSCDGKQTARELADRFCSDPTVDLESAEEVYDLLRQFCAQQLVDWSLRIPSDPRAAPALLDQIREIAEERVRRVCLASFEELERARQGVAAAAGDVEKLEQALSHLNETFTRLTGTAATRSPGKTYAARTIVYEDCRRDLEMKLGPQLLQAIGKPLLLLLSSARWFTLQAAESFRELAGQIYRQLSAEEGTPVDTLAFWSRIEPFLRPEGRGRYLDAVVSSLHQRWGEILQIDPEQQHLHFTSEELYDRVQEAFEAPSPGWQHAIYHSPDLMIAAPSIEAVQRGDYTIVLGEIHAGINTLDSWLFASQHVDPATISKNIADDMPEPGVMISWNKTVDFPTRINDLPPPRNIRIVPPMDHVLNFPEGQELPAADLMIVDSDDGLVLQSRDGRLRLDIAEAMGRFLSWNLFHLFDLSSGHHHLPRISIDRLVVARESWVFDVDELEFAAVKNPGERFLAVRRWALAHSLPRFLFVGLPHERKPLYLDLCSIAYIDQLAKGVRRAREHSMEDRHIKITEMLPTPHQTWLTDSDGRRYTSELRVVVTDQSRSRNRDVGPSGVNRSDAELENA